MLEKEAIFKAWKENGIDDELLREYCANEKSEDESLPYRQKVGLWVPVDKESDSIQGREIKISVSLEDADKEYDDLLDLFLNGVYDYVNNYANKLNDNWRHLMEPGKYNLPAWSDDFFSEKTLEYIIDNHTRNNKLDNLVRIYAHKVQSHFSLSDHEILTIHQSIVYKLENGGSFDKFEEQVADYLLLRYNRCDFFPDNMSREQIKATIIESYDNTRRHNKRRFPTKRDIENEGWGDSLYHGRSGYLIIHFWFDFEDNKITTAYPILNKPESKSLDKERREK